MQCGGNSIIVDRFTADFPHALSNRSEKTSATTMPCASELNMVEMCCAALHISAPRPVIVVRDVVNAFKIIEGK
jgi:hypothetical protein